MAGTIRKKTFGEKLLAYRKKTGLTQFELGEMVDISQHHICSYEKHGVLPHSLKLKDMAAVMGTTMDDLMEGE